MKFVRTNQGTCINQCPLVNKNDRVEAGQVRADSSATENGELARDFLRGQTRYSQVAQIAEHAIEDAGALHSETAQQATFETPNGERTIIVGPAAQPIELLPSCGKPTKSILPLITTAEVST